MFDNKIYGDLASRCGGEVCIGITENATHLALEDKLSAAFAESNYKIKVADSPSNASFGIVTTCDEGRDAAAEERAVNAYKKANRPCVIVLNSSSAQSGSALKNELEQKYSTAVVTVNAGIVPQDSIAAILTAALFEFPLTSFDVDIPEWMGYLSCECSAIKELLEKVRSIAPKIKKMKDGFDDMLSGCEFWKNEPSIALDLANGKARITASAKDGIYYAMLSEMAGDKIADECSLMKFVSATAEAKRSYDKIKDAFECAKINGYGIVEPTDGDLSLDKPQVVRQGSNVGIKLKATAPSYHVVKVDVTGEVSPIMGNARQSEGIVEGMMNGFESNPEGMWETNLFGKSLRGMVKEGLAGKVTCMQDQTKTKMRKAITRIINEGKGGVICILL